MIIEKDNIPNKKIIEILKEGVTKPIPPVILFPFFLNIDYIL